MTGMFGGWQAGLAAGDVSLKHRVKVNLRDPDRTTDALALFCVGEGP